MINLVMMFQFVDLIEKLFVVFFGKQNGDPFGGKHYLRTKFGDEIM